MKIAKCRLVDKIGIAANPESDYENFKSLINQKLRLLRNENLCCPEARNKATRCFR
jgi:hypothetical protein